MHITPDGRKYIGCTKKVPLRKRFGRGSKYRREPFKSAIQFFGWDSIKHEVICTIETEQEALEIEESLIRKYKTYDIRYGFNAYIGKRPVYTEERRKKMSEAITGKHWKLVDGKRIYY